MATITGARASAKRVQIREAVFPGAESVVYGGGQKGWRVIPRTLPLIMTLVTRLAPKGKAAGAARAYLDLWCRDFGEGYVELTDEDEHAFASGYTSEARGVRLWRECVEVLRDLGFIKIAPKGSRAFGYVLLLHPDIVVDTLRQTCGLDNAWSNAYEKRMIEIGARQTGDGNIAALTPTPTNGEAATVTPTPPSPPTISGTARPARSSRRR